MNKLFVATLSVALLGTLSSVAQVNQSPYLTKSFAGQAIQQVEVETSGGSIHVTGGEPADSRVEVYIQGNNGWNKLSKEEIQERLDKYYDVTINFDGKKLVASARPKDQEHMNWKESLSISFYVYAPRAVSTDLSTSGGSIHLSDLHGETERFETSGGSLHVDNLSGKIEGTTSGGSIHVSNSKDDIHLTTSGGSIEATDCSGHIHLGTSGGGLHLANLSGDIDAGTSGGSIEGNHIQGDLKTETSGGSISLDDLNGSVDASTSGGSIHVDMTGVNKEVRLHTSAGSITLNLPSGKGLDLNLRGDHVETSNLGAFQGTSERDYVEGKTNGGGIPVVVDANSGHVSVTGK